MDASEASNLFLVTASKFEKEYFEKAFEYLKKKIFEYQDGTAARRWMHMKLQI